MKWKYTVIHHPARIALGLNNNEYSILDIIYKSQTHPKYTVSGWANTGCHKIASFLSLSPATVLNVFIKAEKMGLLEFNESRMLKRTTAAWYEVAYLEADCFEDDGCSKTDCSETEHRTVQKLNTYRSENEPKVKEDKSKDKTTHTSASAKANSHTLKDNPKTPPIPAARPSFDDVDYIEVAKQMADYFENDERGKTEWEWMCSTKRIRVKPLAITSQWAAKHQDAPYMLQNWRNHTGKLINWIREQSDTGKHTGTNQPATTYEAPRTAHRATKRKKISKEEFAEIQKLTQNAKFSK